MFFFSSLVIFVLRRYRNDLPRKVPRQVSVCFSLCLVFSCFSDAGSIAKFRISWLVIRGSLIKVSKQV